MCGRFALYHSGLELAQAFNVPEPPLFSARYNIAPSQPVLAFCQEVGQKAEWRQLYWGLVPAWSQEPKVNGAPINARCETVAEKPTFRGAARRRRCVVPVSGFYEWILEAKGEKQPLYLSDSQGRPLMLAGIWERWIPPRHSPVRDVLETVALLTTTPNPMISTLHDRMPVIISKEHIPIWLDTERYPLEELADLFFPASEPSRYWPVSRLVSSFRNEGEDLIKPVDPELSAPQTTSRPRKSRTRSATNQEQGTLFGDMDESIA